VSEETFSQVALKAGGVRGWQADVLVEMKHRDHAPVDGAVRHEMLEHLELARAGGHDDDGETFGADGGTDDAAGRFSGQTAERLFIGGFGQLPSEKDGGTDCRPRLRLVAGPLRDWSLFRGLGGVGCLENVQCSWDRCTWSVS
jgi:hypothetical protein